MADEGRQPVAIRIARPYPSEEAFLEHELDTLTRTSVVLLGAQSRPQGVVLRFEVTLASGAPLLRGEGRVVGFKPNALNDEPGLTLRFTRLDPRSKALIDRAAALRDARARGVVREPAAYEGHLEATHAGPPPSMGNQGPPPLPPRSVPAPRSSQPPTWDSFPGRPAPPSRTSPPPLPLSPLAPRAPMFAPAFSEEAPSQTTTYDRESLDRLRSERLEREAEDIPPPTNIGAPLSSADGLLPHATISEPPPAVGPRNSAPPRASSIPAPGPTTIVPSASSGPPTAPRPPRDPHGSPPDRKALLDRLRERARDLAPARVRAILQAKRA